MLVTWAPTSTTASPPVFSSSIPAPVAPTARTIANGTRSSPIGSSFALVAARDEGVHHRLLRRHQQESEHLPALDLDLLDQVVVEDRLVDRHRDELLHLEPEGLPELLLGHRRERDLAHDDALVPHAHPDLPGLEPPARPELAQGLRHGLHLADLAVLDGTGRKRHLRCADDGRRRSFRQLGGPNGGRTDVEPDPRLRH